MCFFILLIKNVRFVICLFVFWSNTLVLQHVFWLLDDNIWFHNMFLLRRRYDVAIECCYSSYWENNEFEWLPRCLVCVTVPIEIVIDFLVVNLFSFCNSSYQENLEFEWLLLCLISFKIHINAILDLNFCWFVVVSGTVPNKTTLNLSGCCSVAVSVIVPSFCYSFQKIMNLSVCWFVIV